MLVLANEMFDSPPVFSRIFVFPTWTSSKRHQKTMEGVGGKGQGKPGRGKPEAWTECSLSQARASFPVGEYDSICGDENHPTSAQDPREIQQTTAITPKVQIIMAPAPLSRAIPQTGMALEAPILYYYRVRSRSILYQVERNIGRGVTNRDYVPFGKRRYLGNK